VAATTVRLPDDLHERLASYCATTGAVMNRVMALALASTWRTTRLLGSR
jgi:predicted transcriptional regulator